ncbi:SMI1/KNR4 family protein [Humisphaera borealis]|uniref:SMI1/KNR4 family protein n=1 Tax=Humisphaera borealis TaxID=2807512 RepID=A0A7M2WSM9_9BACT|nr:SMI1/KNR4 family protein [Humisphaera borealis]
MINFRSGGLGTIRPRTSGADDSELRKFEGEFGYRIPNTYRHFLATVNGGTFTDPFPISLPAGSFSDATSLFTLYSLDSKNPRSGADVREVLRLHATRIPTGSLPIGDDGDNLLLIHCIPNRAGHISLWVREDEWDKAPEENSVPVADSFESCFGLS